MDPFDMKLLVPELMGILLLSWTWVEDRLGRGEIAAFRAINSVPPLQIGPG